MKISNYIANIVLILFSLALALIICDILIAFSPLDLIYERSLMFSSPTFQLDQNGAVRYQIKKNIRTVAVYNNKIEYDSKFTTNNLGFIDDKDYESNYVPNKKYYAFVGDSFTAGFHGGKPWVPELRKEIEGRNIEIYNFGVTGTGIDHFFRLLKSTREQLPITHIVIVAISHDLRRGFWYPYTNASEIRFCPEEMNIEQCAETPYIAKIIDPTFSNEDILKVADSMMEGKENGFKLGLIGVLRQSKLLSFVVRAVKTRLHKKTRNYEKHYLIDTLRKFRQEFPTTEIYFIHLPQKKEVRIGEYLIKDIEEDIEKMGISYFPALTECHWQKDMFFVHDGHPNMSGSDNIKDCVSSYLFR